MKYADVTPIHKKDDKTDKTNYRPNIYERLIYNQIFLYFDAVYYKFEKWRKTLHEEGETRAVLTDHTKAFDCIDHDLLNTYVLEKGSLEFIHFYLTEHKQRTKVSSTFISWEMLFSGCHKSQFQDHFYSIFILVVCFFKTLENISFTGYAGDNTPNTYSSKIEHVLIKLQCASEELFRWFSANHLEANAGKRHLLTSSSLPFDIRITNTKIAYLNTESIPSLAPRIWELIPCDIRNANSLGMFKEKYKIFKKYLKFWSMDKCPCKLCKTYIRNISFI